MADDLVFVPRVGFRSAHALGTRANVVATSGERTLTAAITPDRDGIRVQLTVAGIAMDHGANGTRFEDPVRIHDDSGRDISTPRPRWQVGGFLRRASDGSATLDYTTLLEPLAEGVRAVDLALTGAAGQLERARPGRARRIRRDASARGRRVRHERRRDGRSPHRRAI